MAKIIPILDNLGLQKLKSKAEAKTYLRCKELDDNCIVIFSFPWISISPYGTPNDGETDFVVFHKTKGVLTIEVKGGGISFDPVTDVWASRNFEGIIHVIKNPFKQSKGAKYSLLDYLQKDQEWSYLKLRPTLGHAVLFPDISSANNLLGSDRPKEIVGTLQDMERFPAWVESVFDYWGGEGASNSTVPLGARGMDYVERHFCKPIMVRPLLSTVLREEETERIRLTEEQRRLVSLLKQQKRAAISGGAGTGKTLIALNRARELAEKGLKVLLLCFNQLLADQLNEATEDVANLNAMSFHQLCSWYVRMAQEKTGKDLLKSIREENPDKDDYHYCFPLALAEAIEFVDRGFDAIIIDEAQDFRDEYWLPIHVLTEDSPEKFLLIFYDHNQQIYTKSSLFPIETDPFVLTRNCRNAEPIHNLAYQFYKGIETESSAIAGSEIEFISGPSRAIEAKRLHSHLTSLLTKESVSPADICVLVPSKDSRAFISLLEPMPLPGKIHWSVNAVGGESSVCIETVMRFKGLEADYIYFWGADEFDRETDAELLYVTLSRAKSRLCLIGNETDCRNLLPTNSRPSK